MISNYGEDVKKLPSHKVNWKVREKNIKDMFSDQIPPINNYKIRRMVSGNESQQIFLEKDIKVEYILKILKNKRSNLIKKLNRKTFSYYEERSFASYYENLRLDEIDEDVLRFQLEAYINTSDGFAIDYLEALKYKELIEEEIQLKEEDLFKNL